MLLLYLRGELSRDIFGGRGILDFAGTSLSWPKDAGNIILKNSFINKLL